MSCGCNSKNRKLTIRNDFNVFALVGEKHAGKSNTIRKLINLFISNNAKIIYSNIPKTHTKKYEFL